ncbi:hypothetical protein [Alsobacter sp. R-9]
MTLEGFADSLSQPIPPADLTPALLGLWHDARGDWDGAHRCVQDDETPDGSWVHAYLHRKEGDLGNAGYWYRRAGRAVASGPLADEWAAIARDLLAHRT